MKFLMAAVFIFHGLLGQLAIAKAIDPSNMTEEQFYQAVHKTLTENLKKGSKRVMNYKKDNEEKLYKIINRKFKKIEKRLAKVSKKTNFDPQMKSDMEKNIADWKEEIQLAKDKGTLLEDVKEIYSHERFENIASDIVEHLRSEDLFPKYKNYFELKESNTKYNTELVGEIVLLATIFVLSPTTGLIILGVGALFVLILFAIVAAVGNIW